MVCQNCQSTDIVTIQGQNYCINCGKLVASTPAKALKNPIATQLKPTLPAVRSKPSSPLSISRPAAAEKAATKSTTITSTPKPKVTAGHTASSTAVSVKPIKVIANIKTDVAVKPPERKGAPEIATSALPSVKAQPITPPVLPIPASVSTSIEPRVLKPSPKMSDLRPVRATTSVASPAPKVSYPTDHTDILSTPPPPNPVAPAQTAPQAAAENHRSLALAIETAWSGANLWQFFKFGLTAVILNLLPLLVFILHRPPVEIQSLSTLTARLGSLALTVVAAIIAVSLVVYILTTVLQNTVIYGSAKRADNRTSNPHNWLSAGVSSFWSVFAIDVILVISAILVGLAALGASSLIQHLVADQFFMTVAQRVVIGLAVYLAIALLLIRQLAVNSTVIGGFRASKSLGLAYNIWHRQSSWLFGAGACITALSLLAAALYTGLVYGFSLGLSSLHFSLPRLTLPITTLLLGWLWLSLWLCFSWIFWQAIFRQAVKHSHPTAETRLLGGRSADKPNRYQLATIWLTVLLLLSSATYLTLAVR